MSPAHVHYLMHPDIADDQRPMHPGSRDACHKDNGCRIDRSRARKRRTQIPGHSKAVLTEQCRLRLMFR